MKNEHHIYGPPGTGKTTALARNMERASEKRGFDAVLCCSHTKAAAAEIAGREVHVNPDNVGTLHALCYRKLNRPNIAETMFSDWNALHPGYAIKGTGHNIDDLESGRATEDGNSLLQEISRLRNLMVPKERWRFRLQRFHRKWEEFKLDGGLLDFTDMIEYSLETPPPDGIEVVFVDEAQDFSALQFELVRGWLEHIDQAVFVGDDDQAIFGFSGADPENLISRPIPDENRRVLKKSYRVPKNVHRVATTFIQRCSRRLDKEYLPRDGDDGEFKRSSDGDWKNPAAIVDSVEQEISDCETKTSKIMILASCGYMLAPLLRELRERGIAYHNPYRQAHGGWNPLKAGEKSTVNRLAAFLKKSNHNERDPGWSWYDLHLWLDLIRTRGVVKSGMRKVVEEKATNPGKHVELGYEEWDAVFEGAALGHAIQQNPSWLHANATARKMNSLTLPLKILARGGEDLLNRSPQVIVGTIHSVKGGEADSVMLFPDLSLQAGENWIRKGPARDSVLRCFYVGMTRARHRLTMLQPADGGIFIE